MTARKGYRDTTRSVAKIHRSLPQTKLLIVGSGPELEKIKRNSARLSIEADCTVMPAVSKVAPFLRAIDIFASSSYSEAFSNSILEAMASGCCVVGSRSGALPNSSPTGRAVCFLPRATPKSSDRGWWNLFKTLHYEERWRTGRQSSRPRNSIWK